MGLWLFELNWHDSNRFVIWGSSNLTLKGLEYRRGEQNDYSYDLRRYDDELERWNRFAYEAIEVTPRTWGWVRRQCWSRPQQSEEEGG
jgi:hypothetical protein